jgi:methyl-accepting chemotaxis protein
MSDVLDGLTEVEEFLVFVVQEFGGGGDDLRVRNNDLSGLLKSVSDALEEVEFIINFIVMLGEDLDEFNSLLNNFRVSFNIVDSLLDAFFSLVNGIVEVEEFFIIVMLNVLNGLGTMLDSTDVVTSLDVLVDIEAILGNVGDFTSDMSDVLNGLTEIEEFFIFVVQEFGGGGDDLGVLNNELSSLLKSVSDALEDVEFIIIVVGDGLDEVNSLNNKFRVRDGVFSSLLGILLDFAQDVEFFIRESDEDGSFGESGGGSVDGDSGLDGVVDGGVIDGHFFIIQEFGSGGDNLGVLNDELSSLLKSVSDALEDVEFVFDFIIFSKDLDGGGDNLGVLNNEFTSFLDISLEGAPEVEFIITDFVISGEDLGGGGNNLRVFNNEVSSLLDTVTEALEEVKFIITDFIVSVEDLDGSVDEFGVLNNEVTSLLGIVGKDAPEVEFVFRDFIINSEDLGSGGDDLGVGDNELTSFLDVVSEGLEEVELVVFHSFRSQREGSNSSNSEDLLHFEI